eukprot:1424966-Rhodomonas_salina.7
MHLGLKIKSTLPKTPYKPYLQQAHLAFISERTCRDSRFDKSSGCSRPLQQTAGQTHLEGA